MFYLMLYKKLFYQDSKKSNKQPLALGYTHLGPQPQPQTTMGTDMYFYREWVVFCKSYSQSSKNFNSDCDC